MAKDEIVRVKKSMLQALLDSNEEAHKILDEISSSAGEVAEKIAEAFSKLENAEPDIETYIIEDEGDDE